MPEKRTKKSLKSTKHHATRKIAHPKTATKKRVAAKKVVKKAAAPAKAKAQAAAAVVKDGSLQVFDIKGKSIDTLKLDALFQGHDVNEDVVYQAVIMYQAGKHVGTASTLDRGHVRGGGKKPWKQKGTGQARHGSRRSPIWRGGGVTFGPMPRDYSYSIPSQIRRSAVAETFKDKVLHGKAIILNDLQIAAPKTKLIVSILETFKLEKPLFLVDKRSENLLLASRNIKNVTVKTAQEVNALDVAGAKECVMTKAAYTGLVKRLKS